MAPAALCSGHLVLGVDMDDLKCNSLRCRKSLGLEGSAVVTTCSHIFCIDCANALFSLPQICPACETALPDPDDVVQTSLNPHDSYKTSILAGLSPNIILDIAGRALNFYAYQVQQEAAFQTLITKNAQERIAFLEAQCNTVTREAYAEVHLLKEKLARSEKDLELQKRRNHDLQETHKANAKAYQKLRLQYDKAKQRALFEGAEASGGGPPGQLLPPPPPPNVAGSGTPAFQQGFVSALGGRSTPRPGQAVPNHQPFSSVARHNAGRESVSSWTSVPTTTDGVPAPGGAGSGFAHPAPQHYGGQGKPFLAGQTGATSHSRPSRARHEAPQARGPAQKQPQQQQLLPQGLQSTRSRHSGSVGSSTHSNDSRTLSAAEHGTGFLGGASMLQGVGGQQHQQQSDSSRGSGFAPQQSWVNGGFVSGGGGGRPVGGGAGAFRPAGTANGRSA